MEHELEFSWIISCHVERSVCFPRTAKADTATKPFPDAARCGRLGSESGTSQGFFPYILRFELYRFIDLI